MLTAINGILSYTLKKNSDCSTICVICDFSSWLKNLENSVTAMYTRMATVTSMIGVCSKLTNLSYHFGSSPFSRYILEKSQLKKLRPSHIKKNSSLQSLFSCGSSTSGVNACGVGVTSSLFWGCSSSCSS